MTDQFSDTEASLVDNVDSNKRARVLIDTQGNDKLPMYKRFKIENEEDNHKWALSNKRV